MNKIFILILVLFSGIPKGFAQAEIHVEPIESVSLIKVLNNAKEIGNDREGNISARIYILDNGPSSANIPEGHEVSHNVLIAVSEYDEYPTQNLFSVGPFYNPKLKSLDSDTSSKVIQIEYGPFDERQSIEMKLDIKELQLLN